MIASSLLEVGPGRSIVIDEDDRILAGNGVATAASKAGFSKVRIIEPAADEIIAVRRRGLSAEQKRKLAIYDNRTGELATWDLAQLERDRVAGLELIPFWTGAELADLLAPPGPKPGKTDPDAAPALRATAIRRGDGFALGDHRLLCGDATDHEDVARLFADDAGPAPLCFTSPPYADQRDYSARVNLSVDHLAGFLEAPRGRVELFAVNLGLMRRGGVVVPYWDRYLARAAAGGLALLSWNVWKQSLQASPGKLSAMFPIAHEFIFVLGPAARALHKTVPNISAGRRRHPVDRQPDGSLKPKRSVVIAARRALSTVVEVPNNPSMHDAATSGHPARFPVALPLAYIEACTDAGAAVYEPFTGSGSTLIACEQTGRRCRALELDPAWVQMTIDRWEAFTGGVATALPAARARRRRQG